jgi:hypothetical protein
MKVFFFSHFVQTTSGAHPATYPLGTEDSFTVGKVAGESGWLTTPSSEEVKNAWTYTSIHPDVFPMWCLIEQGTYLNSMMLS